jgi:D-lactate dehydrogenase (cytochrome)
MADTIPYVTSSSSTTVLQAGLAEMLRARFGERFSTAAAVREHHSKDESYHAPQPPDAVLFPATTEEVSEAVRLCAAHDVPIVPFGAGSSLEGHVLAVRGGLAIDLSRMTAVLRVSPEDIDATVEAGVTHRTLNHHLRNSGLMFSVDPGADATLGGMAATRASGTMAVRYGTMRENVLGLTVVLADGRVIRTGSRARKSAAGYDLTKLFVGSEGTLGIITEVTLRLHPRPEALAVAVCQFATIAGAVDTVIQVMQLALPVARIELLDERAIEAIVRHAGLTYALAPTLLLEFHGDSEAIVADQLAGVEAIAAEHGGAGFALATTTEERTRLWKVRHDFLYAGLALRPGARAWTTDVCVPISRLADCIVETKADSDASPLIATLVGHVGDGNFHMLYLVNPDDPAELAEARRLTDRMVTRALAMGGTCTGEHGIGLGKIDFLIEEHGETAIGVMRTIKQALDPQNLLNPGKVIRV